MAIRLPTPFFFHWPNPFQRPGTRVPPLRRRSRLLVSDAAVRRGLAGQDGHERSAPSPPYAPRSKEPDQGQTPIIGGLTDPVASSWVGQNAAGHGC